MTQPRLLVNQVDRIIALDQQPVLRNLLITQCYHDLSSELARVLGAGNANWCTFATWASKTAGSFIRNEEVPELLRQLLVDSHGVRTGAQRVSNDLRILHPETTLGVDELMQVGRRVVADVSGQITAGNLKVFSELAPVFARFIHLFDNGAPDPVAANRLLSSLRVGPSAKDGQSLLKEALEHYLAAFNDRDMTRKAQHMLAANALTGLHEQIRLQSYIAGSLNAPIQDVLGGLLHEHTTKLADTSLFGRIHALWDRWMPTFVHEVEKTWAMFSAKELMTLTVPEQVLHLGSTLPPVSHGRPLYPRELTHVVNESAYQLLEQYQVVDPKAEGDVGANDWTVLAQRMRYIIALFRSRQAEHKMMNQPFSATQLNMLWQNQVPAGAL